jgi:hypothetical protein
MQRLRSNAMACPYKRNHLCCRATPWRGHTNPIKEVLLHATPLLYYSNPLSAKL